MREDLVVSRSDPHPVPKKSLRMNPVNRSTPERRHWIRLASRCQKVTSNASARESIKNDGEAVFNVPVVRPNCSNVPTKVPTKRNPAVHVLSGTTFAVESTSLPYVTLAEKPVLITVSAVEKASRIVTYCPLLTAKLEGLIRTVKSSGGSNKIAPENRPLPENVDAEGVTPKLNGAVEPPEYVPLTESPEPAEIVNSP